MLYCVGTLPQTRDAQLSSVTEWKVMKNMCLKGACKLDFNMKCMSITNQMNMSVTFENVEPLVLETTK